MDQRRLIHDGFFRIWEVENKKGKREVVEACDSVAVLLFCPKNKKIVLVRQRRAAMVTGQNPEGFIVEVIAGRMNKGLPVRETMVEEIWEEAKIRVEPEDIILLNSYVPLASTPGMTTEKICLGLVAIPEGQMPEAGRMAGLAQEGESTEVIVRPLDAFEGLVCEDMKTLTLIQTLRIQLLLEEVRKR